MTSLFDPLLAYLAHQQPAQVSQWEGWQIWPIAGGMNNMVYRVRGAAGAFAVKFTMRDQRDRAGREYGALLALHQAGLFIAPEPILLAREGYGQPVVVLRWLEGEVKGTPPTSEAEWGHLLEHYLTMHSLTPAQTDVELPTVVLHADSLKGCRVLVREQLALLPPQAQPLELQHLVDHWEKSPLPDWTNVPSPPRALAASPPRQVAPSPPRPIAPSLLALSRGDGNVLNMIRRPDQWLSVDWEYAGWGDPAFSIAELRTHPAYIDVPPARWGWFIERYCAAREDMTARLRIDVYIQTMLIWWTIRLARVLYEVPRGQDKRLVERPSGWLADKEVEYRHYLAMAQESLRAL